MVKAVVCKAIAKASQVRVLALPNENIKRTPNIINSKRDVDRFTSTGKFKLRVGIRELIRTVSNNTNSDGDIFSNALHSACRYGV